MINRYQLVSRHCPKLTQIDTHSPLSVGNGEFAFTADITGLQSFPEVYNNDVPLCTQSQWGWHTTPPEVGIDSANYPFRFYDTYGRKVPYAIGDNGQEEIYHWMRKNPHRLDLGQIGLEIIRSDGTKAEIKDITGIEQTLELWNGTIISRFLVEGIAVTVKTICHPDRDILAVSIQSELIKMGRLFITMNFPYGSPEKEAADWSQPEKHKTEIIEWEDNSFKFLRKMDKDGYFVHIQFSDKVILEREDAHRLQFKAREGTNEIFFSTLFSQNSLNQSLPSYKETEEQNSKFWEGFWLEGGAIELYKSSDPRAFELERRIILSQYLTAIQCSGSIPPQETGLTCNSWFGKPHLEMHFWHAAHFPLWGRTKMLEKSLWWYKSIMQKALELAQMQGYEGARWPKMVDAEGNNCPSPIAGLLIWQQPHPIYYAELCYRTRPCKETLEIYKEIVFNTAEFMASYAHLDVENDRFVLGPPVIPAQENHEPEDTLNPTFELEYWVFGLEIAQTWKKRLGLTIDPRWESVILKISKLPELDGIYMAHENCPHTFTKYNIDHPSMLGAYGILPGKLVDTETMRRTLHKVFKDWDWDETWGWDYPMVAMCAARLGEPGLAVDALLMDAPKNEYVLNGHNRQGTKEDLPLYLPGNGGLLLAVAMMAAGWDNGPNGHAPGFPSDGTWTVIWEGLKPII